MCKFNLKDVICFDPYFKENEFDDYAFVLYGEDIIERCNYCEVFLKDGEKVILTNHDEIIDFIEGLNYIKFMEV